MLRFGFRILLELLRCGGKLADFRRQAVCSFLQGEKKAYVTLQNENKTLCVQQNTQQ